MSSQSYFFYNFNGRLLIGGSNAVNDTINYVPPSPPVLTFSNPQGSDVNAGASITGGISYNIYTFRSTAVTYSFTYTVTRPTTINVLVVGGGGSGANNAGGGGGAGAVVFAKIRLPSGSNKTITINVGKGGLSVPGSTSYGNIGKNTSISFPANPELNIIAGGGGPGTGVGTAAGAFPTLNIGGSGGGSCWNSTPNPANTMPSSTANITYYGNAGGIGYNTGTTISSGGGGAGATGVNLISTSTKSSDGGDGILCTLDGIKDYLSYGTYYWGGGGGGGSSGYLGGNGGKGGGGGGTSQGGASGNQGLNDTYNLASGTGTSASSATGGGSGINGTGGGGGGAWQASGTFSGAGGDGIVIIAFPSGTPPA